MTKRLRLVAVFAVILGVPALSCHGCSSTPDKPARSRKKKKKKKKKKPKVVAKLPQGAKEGVVMFSFKDAGLRRDVLPVFYTQAGVRIKWTGPERKVTLRLTQPIDWNIALDLVCRFTKTHPTKNYQGQIILKPGYGGSLGSSGEAEEILEEAGEEGAVKGSGGKGPTSRSKRRYPKSSSGSAYRETTENARGSGGKRSGYNSGNQPGDLFKKIR